MFARRALASAFCFRATDAARGASLGACDDCSRHASVVGL